MYKFADQDYAGLRCYESSAPTLDSIPLGRPTIVDAGNDAVAIAAAEVAMYCSYAALAIPELNAAALCAN